MLIENNKDCCVILQPNTYGCCTGPFNLTAVCTYGEVTLVSTDLNCDYGDFVILRREGNQLPGTIVDLGSFNAPFVFVDGIAAPITPGQLYTYYLVNSCGGVVSAEIPIIACDDKCCRTAPALTFTEPSCITDTIGYPLNITLSGGDCPTYELYKKILGVWTLIHTFSGQGDFYIDNILAADYCVQMDYRVIGTCLAPGVESIVDYKYGTNPCCPSYTSTSITASAGEVTITFTGTLPQFDACMNATVLIERSRDLITWITINTGSITGYQFLDYPTPDETWYYRITFDYDVDECLPALNRCVPVCFDDGVYVPAMPCCAGPFSFINIGPYKLQTWEFLRSNTCVGHNMTYDVYWKYLADPPSAYTYVFSMPTQIVAIPQMLQGPNYEFKMVARELGCPDVEVEDSILFTCYSMIVDYGPKTFSMPVASLPNIISIQFNIYVPCCCPDKTIPVMTVNVGALPLTVTDISFSRPAECEKVILITAFIQIEAIGAVVGTYQLETTVDTCGIYFLSQPQIVFPWTLILT